MSDDKQQRDYSGSSASGKSKLISSGDLPDKIKAGGSGDGSGPTGSSRSYPKGKSHSTDTKAWNPMNTPAGDWVVGGR